MLPHEVISRAMLKSRGKPLAEPYGLPVADFRELSVLAYNCAKELGLSVTSLGALGPNGRKGVRLSLESERRTYSIVLSQNTVYLESAPFGAQPKQVFRNNSFNHRVAGQLFAIIQGEERKWPAFA